MNNDEIFSISNPYDDLTYRRKTSQDQNLIRTLSRTKGSSYAKLRNKNLLYKEIQMFLESLSSEELKKLSESNVSEVSDIERAIEGINSFMDFASCVSAEKQELLYEIIKLPKADKNIYNNFLNSLSQEEKKTIEKSISVEDFDGYLMFLRAITSHKAIFNLITIVNNFSSEKIEKFSQLLKYIREPLNLSETTQQVLSNANNMLDESSKAYDENFNDFYNSIEDLEVHAGHAVRHKGRLDVIIESNQLVSSDALKDDKLIKDADRTLGVSDFVFCSIFFLPKDFNNKAAEIIEENKINSDLIIRLGNKDLQEAFFTPISLGYKVPIFLEEKVDENDYKELIATKDIKDFKKGAIYWLYLKEVERIKMRITNTKTPSEADLMIKNNPSLKIEIKKKTKDFVSEVKRKQCYLPEFDLELNKEFDLPEQYRNMAEFKFPNHLKFSTHNPIHMEVKDKKYYLYDSANKQKETYYSNSFPISLNVPYVDSKFRIPISILSVSNISELCQKIKLPRDISSLNFMNNLIKELNYGRKIHVTQHTQLFDLLQKSSVIQTNISKNLQNILENSIVNALNYSKENARRDTKCF